jgi:hypothetical protein
MARPYEVSAYVFSIMLISFNLVIVFYPQLALIHPLTVMIVDCLLMVAVFASLAASKFIESIRVIQLFHVPGVVLFLSYKILKISFGILESWENVVLGVFIYCTFVSTICCIRFGQMDFSPMQKITGPYGIGVKRIWSKIHSNHILAYYPIS